MFTKILVPLDGSRMSAKSLPYAIDVAKKFNAEIILLQVVERVNPIIPTGSDVALAGSSYVIDIAVKAARIEEQKKLSHARTYLRAKLKQLIADGIKASFNVSIGEPSETILNYCRKNKVDLVVMTTSGKTGLKRAILGSVADKIIRDPRFPVLVIRSRSTRKK